MCVWYWCAVRREDDAAAIILAAGEGVWHSLIVFRRVAFVCRGMYDTCQDVG